MQKICDLHVHRKYSGEASKIIDVIKIGLNSEKKGIDIIGTSDCLFPDMMQIMENCKLKNILILHGWISNF